MLPTKSIVGNLGYYKAENGNYYEGTWKNDSLIYGLVYLADQNMLFAGSFDESGRSDCSGVAFDLSKADPKNGKVTTMVGNFRIRDGQLSLYDSECLINIANVKNNELSSIDAYLGQYAEGDREGTFINKEISDSIRIRWDKYKDGEIQSGMSSIEILPRTLMMVYTCIWYLVKYVYGTIFLVTPLYYSSKKKNWKI